MGAPQRAFLICIYIYIYTHICMYVYIYIYVYVERERERERGRVKEIYISLFACCFRSPDSRQALAFLGPILMSMAWVSSVLWFGLVACPGELLFGLIQPRWAIVWVDRLPIEPPTTSTRSWCPSPARSWHPGRSQPGVSSGSSVACVCGVSTQDFMHYV